MLLNPVLLQNTPKVRIYDLRLLEWIVVSLEECYVSNISVLNCKNVRIVREKKKGKLNSGKGNEMHFKDLITLKEIKSLSKVINYLKYTTSNTLIIQSCPFASFLRTP